MNTKALGRWGEQYAVKYCRKIGLKILATNWHFSRKGEIDIIVKDGNKIVFIEVKTRRTAQSGRPIEAVNHQKYLTIRRCISAYLSINDIVDVKVRIDVIGIHATSEAIKLQHFKGVHIWL